jgi:hypothetical protein
MIRDHGFDPQLSRRLFSLAIPSAEELPQIALPSRHFVTLIAWDARRMTVQAISQLVEALLRAGSSYFVCWGPDCMRVHDIVDELASYPDSEFDFPASSVVMTTWHEREPLAEALEFFLDLSEPDEHFGPSTQSSLAISIGSQGWAAEIAAALDKRDQDGSRRRG